MSYAPRPSVKDTLRGEVRPRTWTASRRESRWASALAVLLEALEITTSSAPKMSASPRKSSSSQEVKNSGRRSIWRSSWPASYTGSAAVAV